MKNKEEFVLQREQQFIKRAQQKHKNKYIYQTGQYKSSLKHISIICEKHGIFKQTPQYHLAGHGCPKCGKERMLEHASNIKSTKAKNWITNARKIHGDKYIYRTPYISAHQKITIECKRHGEFSQTPSAHLAGNGCPHCANDNRRSNTENFIAQATEIHYNKYDYSKTNYIDANSIIYIICPIHGIFKQKAAAHLSGHGCKQCAIDESRSNTFEFMLKATSKHSGKYSYANTIYNHSGGKVNIICPKHGQFEQIANNHLNGRGCPKCWQETSKQQIEIIEFIENLGLEVKKNDRDIIYPLEIDVLIPNANLGIEFHGIYHHSSNDINRDKYLKYKNQKKALMAFKANIKLLQIFSNEWEKKQNIWKSIISHNLNLSTKYAARKLKIVELKTKQEKQFLNCSHLYGYAPSTICYGLTDGVELLMTMSFVNRKENWEIQRLATKPGCAIIGGKSKLFSHFLKSLNPKRTITFADLRFSSNDCYCNLGFRCLGNTSPNYKYINNNGSIILSRQQCQKHKLSKLLPIFDDKLTEHENMFNNGYRRLWDAGNLKFILE